MKPRRSLVYALCMTLCGLSAALAGPVNINTADAVTLAAELNGIGPVLAAEIVRDREANGLYGSPDELTRVKGVGQRIVEMNRDNIRIRESGQ